jgi:glycosyltransferase involved in cell wall biosynthesis
MKKPNVLHLVEYLYLGGIERLLEQLVTNTGEQANIHFFTYETERLSGIGQQIKEAGFPVFTYKKRAGRDWKLISELKKIIKENKIDVVHTHDFGPIEYAVLLKIIFPKIKLVHTQHTMINFIRHRKYTIFFQFASYFYDRMIGVSQFVKDTILSHCPLMKRSVFRVIPNGVDTNIFKQGALINDQKCLNLVSVSRISREKNLEYILNTCRLLKKADIPFVFHHAGTAKMPETILAINKYIEENELQENIFLHGFTNDTKKIFDLGEIFLSASTTEGHPVAVLEAMACEKICFCSDILPHRELGEEFVHLFDISNETSLFNKLEAHYYRPALVEENKRSQLARQKVIEYFSLDRMVDSYVKQYE